MMRRVISTEISIGGKNPAGILLWSRNCHLKTAAPIARWQRQQVGRPEHQIRSVSGHHTLRGRTLNQGRRPEETGGTRALKRWRINVRGSPGVIITTRKAASSPAGGLASRSPEKTSRRSARGCPMPFDLHSGSPAGNGGLARVPASAPARRWIGGAVLIRRHISAARRVRRSARECPMPLTFIPALRPEMGAWASISASAPARRLRFSNPRLTG
jgi:hypothetical protein